MTGASQPSLDDLAYVRQLAESGVRAPLIGGRFMAWWGIALTVAYLLHHLALTGRIGDGGSIFGLIWFGFMISGLLGQLLLARTMPPKPGAGSAANRAARWIWIAGALAIGSMVVGTTLAARSGAGSIAFDWIVPLGFAVYACALIGTGALAGERITIAAGIGAVVMVGLFAALILHPNRYLLAAAGVALTVLVPGLLLLRSEPRARE